MQADSVQQILKHIHW